MGGLPGNAVIHDGEAGSLLALRARGQDLYRKNCKPGSCWTFAPRRFFCQRVRLQSLSLGDRKMNVRKQPATRFAIAGALHRHGQFRSMPRNAKPLSPALDQLRETVSERLQTVAEKLGLTAEQRTKLRHAHDRVRRRNSSACGRSAGSCFTRSSKPSAMCSRPISVAWRKSSSRMRGKGRRKLPPSGNGPRSVSRMTRCLSGFRLPQRRSA